ncbi:peptide chain release factor N(5)-glutamine methyltransferase [Aquicoccus sp. SCR17]|nr:peptide chain release factor N(5)-glutamine methyltransferase [Carideicomes alvinocaridis]
MTAAEALSRAIATLRAAGTPDPARDARRLLAHAARIDAARVTLIAPDELDEAVRLRFEEMVGHRARHVPVSHLVGEREFYGRRFKVSANVLDPRPETEILVAAALALPFEQVLDLGTGSGCILVTLLAEMAGARGIGTDLSEAACLEAAANAVLNGVQARAHFQRADWFDGVEGQFDLIVSNPPYIALEEMAGLAPDVRDHEPHEALTDGGDGLGAYRAITAGAGRHLVPGGRLLVEIGPSQGAAVAGMFDAARFAGIRILPDLDGRDRVVLGTRR